MGSLEVDSERFQGHAWIRRVPDSWSAGPDPHEYGPVSDGAVLFIILFMGGSDAPAHLVDGPCFLFFQKESENCGRLVDAQARYKYINLQPNNESEIAKDSCMRNTHHS